eukprot:gene16229-biopygen2457
MQIRGGGGGTDAERRRAKNRREGGGSPPPGSREEPEGCFACTTLAVQLGVPCAGSRGCGRAGAGQALGRAAGGAVAKSNAAVDLTPPGRRSPRLTKPQQHASEPRPFERARDRGGVPSGTPPKDMGAIATPAPQPPALLARGLWRRSAKEILAVGPMCLARRRAAPWVCISEGIPAEIGHSHRFGTRNVSKTASPQKALGRWAPPAPRRAAVSDRGRRGAGTGKRGPIADVATAKAIVGAHTQILHLWLGKRAGTLKRGQGTKVTAR